MMTDDDAREDMAHELAIDYELRRRKRMDADCGYYTEDEMIADIDMLEMIKKQNPSYHLPPAWEDPQRHIQNSINAEDKMDSLVEENETNEPDHGCVNLKIKKVKNGFMISTHLDCNTEEIWIAVTTYDIAAICRELAERL